jgi:hypothetical protein
MINGDREGKEAATVLLGDRKPHEFRCVDGGVKREVQPAGDG